MKRLERKKNKASFLLLPMLGPDQVFFDWSYHLVNCYIMDLNYPEYNNHIALLYNYGEWFSPSNLKKILTIENNLHYNVNSKLVKRYEPTTDCSVFIFEVPIQYQEDYNLFLAGKYSKLSPGYKNKIIEFHGESQAKLITGILSRDKMLLSNLHKNLGCLKNTCTCTFNNYLLCNSFSNFELDFNTAEVWDKVSDKEILDIEKQEYIIIKADERNY